MKNKLLILFALLAGLTAGLVFAQPAFAAARDNDDNAIIKNGALSCAELKDKYNKNNTGDLPKIFSYYGISKSMVDNCSKTAVMGSVTKDGRVIANGKTVATGAQSVGRQNMSGSTKVMDKYYQRPTSVSFRSDSIPAFVWLDEHGRFLGAVITSCGNPVKATNVVPKPKPEVVCKAMSVIPAGDNKTFTFKVSRSVKNATYLHTKFMIRDNNGKLLESRNSTSGNINYTHKYGSGSFRVGALIVAKVDGKTVEVTSDACKKSFEIKPPVYKCDNLQVTPAGDNKTFTFKVKRTVKYASYVRTVFIIRDANGTETRHNDADGTYIYSNTTPGKYTVEAQVIVKVNGQEKVAPGSCKGEFTVKEKPKEPIYSCVSLELIGELPEVIEPGTKLSFRATPIADNGAVAQSVRITFGDGTEYNGAFDSDIDHTYTTAGDFTARAYFTFKVGDKTVTAVTSDSCTADVTVTAPPEECKPGIPVGDPRCEEDEIEECKPGIPVDDERCEEILGETDEKGTPEVIAATGPAEVIASLLGIGSLTAAGYYYVTSRRKLAADMLDR